MTCVFVVSAPSGAGKTSLVNELIQNNANLNVAISHTTRPKRVGEIDGVDYYFVNKEKFQSMVNENKLIEYAEVFGNFYGTSVDALINHGNIILEIDWQGYRQVKQRLDNVCGIFILPPSLKDLNQRLLSRKQDDEKTILSRMQQAQKEASHYNEYDYVVVNDEFEKAYKDIKSIIHAKGLETKNCHINLEFL